MSSEAGMSKTGMVKKEDVLRDFVESSRKVLLGFSKESLEESRALITKMVRMGRISQDQASVLENRLQDQTKRHDRAFESQVEAVIRAVTPRIEAIATNELTALERRIAKLEERAGKTQAPQTANV